VGEPGGDVQDPVAERRDLAGGEVGNVGEADQVGPAGHVGRGHDDLEPGGVVVLRPAGKLRSPVALASRMWFSTRACWRCRSSSPAPCPGTTPEGVLVNSAVRPP
jgi:hypothetical protein